MAAAVENSARGDNHTRGMHFARDDAFGLNLHAAFGKNHAVESAGNDHAIAFDLPLDLGALAENHRLLGDDIALHVAVDAERSLDLQRPFHGDALIDEACPVLVAAGL